MGTVGALALAGLASPASAAALSSQSDKITPEDDVTSYNNYYEFGTGKSDPQKYSKDFRSRPWTVKVDGLVKNPRTWDLDELLKGLAVQDRTYRMRCVEAWSMVIPWQGVVLGELITRLDPLPSARFVEFTTLMDPRRMPGQQRPVLPWPYKEGLRMDEAKNNLAILATGIYGKPLPNQNGAPLRLVTPWKYGFKGIKGIVRIRFVESQPITTWNQAIPDEYGFYANVNPGVDHPRWSQAKERRIGEFLRRTTLMFNGYGEQVASMYAGMDLRKYY